MEKISKKPFDDDLPIFIEWMDFLKWILVTTDKFPKSIRFTFVDRIHNLALDVLEDLIQARYSRRRLILLRRLNVKLEKLRIILRICHELRYLPHKSFQHAIFSLNDIGKMLGGWIKRQEVSNETHS